MKTYNTFNEMFSDNSNTNKNLSVFNSVFCDGLEKNGYECGTYKVYSDTERTGYTQFCSIFYDDAPATGFYDGYDVALINTLDGGVKYGNTTSSDIIRRRMYDMLLALPDIKILGRDGGAIICSRSLTKEEAKKIAYKINDIFIDEERKVREDWDKMIAMD